MTQLYGGWRLHRMCTRLLILACSLVFVSSNSALAQTSDISDSPTVGSARWFLQVLPAEAPTDGQSQQGQLYGQLLPSVGRDDLWSAYELRVRNAGACELALESSRSMQDQIAELARSTQIVIVNEAHDTPWHRTATQALLQPLWEQGYRYLAAEAFSELIGDYPDEAFGRLNAGFYTVDPVFGDLIRAAKELGYMLVPYEAPTAPDSVRNGSRSEQIAFREEAQANQLIQRIFDGDAEAKVIVHVGYSHAAEEPIPSFDGTTMPWMAARLKDKTGIDPLTIDQTYCLSPGELPQLTEPTGQMPAGTFDLAIAYPEIAVERGRGKWRLTTGRQWVELPEGTVPASGRAIIEARYASESERAIPVDRLLISAGESIPLVLPAGEFRVTVTEEGLEGSRDYHVLVE